MRFQRVLLVNPTHNAEWRGVTPHIGQAYLAQTLKEKGIEYDVLDMNLGYGLKHLHKKIQEFQPDLVGMSLISLEYKRLYNLVSEVKKMDGKVKTVVGGPHVTILRDTVLKECPAADYGVVYEGEGTLTELCRGIAEDKIQGLLFRDDGHITYTGNRPFVTDLDQLPWPRYEKFERGRYVREITIYSSRGCPHQCIFCPNRIISPVFRVRSPKHVVDEIEYWYDKGYRQFNFDDDNFNMIRERVFGVCDEIERRGLKKLFLRCSNGIRADRVDREMLIRMREVGFHYIAFGVDAGNNKMLAVVKKGETIEAIESAVSKACELGYDVKLLFVVGTPQETREDVEDKVRLSRKHPVQEVHFYNTIPYPGTELYDYVKENNLFLRQPEDYLNDVSCLTAVPVFESPELPRSERIKLYKYLGNVR
ncbi:MAG: cobalamin B12-binding domain-containing protein, partial [Chloroflexi bacterium]|nr:cobalamin B12-binding domain-containing protein [Chloroflexota bacterium]